MFNVLEQQLIHSKDMALLEMNFSMLITHIVKTMKLYESTTRIVKPTLL